MAYNFKKYEELTIWDDFMFAKTMKNQKLCKRLPESYVIFNCKFDLFNAGKCIYTFENRCVEDTGIALSDGAKHIFVNPYGETEKIDDNLKNFLAYLRKGIATDAFTQDMEEEVVRVKNNEEWRVEYMTLEMRERERFKEGRAEGRAEVLYVLVQKGIIQIEDAAEELNISPTEVEADMQKKGYRVTVPV